MAPTDFLACLALCFVFLCLSNEIRHLMFLAQILRQLCLTNFVRLQFHCHTRPGHSLNCFRSAASAVCGSNWQLAMDEDKTLIYQAVNLRANISNEVHAAIGDAAIDGVFINQGTECEATMPRVSV